MGNEPFDTYSTTETGPVGAECPQHAGVHLFEDAVIFEVVDAEGRPVPDGTVGHRLLVTNLYNRTQPLVRYEISDAVALAPATCPCGRPLRLMTAIDGRSDDVLRLPGPDGTPVPVHPNHFMEPVEALAGVRQYQVVHDPARVRVLIVPAPGAPAALAGEVAAAIAGALRPLGVQPPPVEVELVERIERDGGVSGKLKLVRAAAREELAATR